MPPLRLRQDHPDTPSTGWPPCQMFPIVTLDSPLISAFSHMLSVSDECLDVLRSDSRDLVRMGLWPRPSCSTFLVALSWVTSMLSAEFDLFSDSSLTDAQASPLGYAFCERWRLPTLEPYGGNDGPKWPVYLSPCKVSSAVLSSNLVSAGVRPLGRRRVSMTARIRILIPSLVVMGTPASYRY